MKRILVVFCLILLTLIPISSAEEFESKNWEIDLENGYITTKPIFVGDQIIVRTSGYWTGDDRPRVYSFDSNTGEEIWRFSNLNSTNHDMSPLLYIEAGMGACGNWSEMVIVGWTDGKVTALDVSNGSLIWSSQTEVVTWGITGAMAQDDDGVVVPTRQGLSRFCLSDGGENLRIDLPQLGWRNGVTVTEQSYLLGNEEGVVNIINKSGEISNYSVGMGKIRHAPIQTQAGILVHLQTSGGSEIYLGSELLSEEGPSPAIPLLFEGDVFFATSESISVWNCEGTCTFEGRSIFHSNGEITVQKMGTNSTIWFPRNTPGGGWGYGIPGQEITVYSTNHDTYTTAGVGFGPDGQMAFGNDAGILMVISGDQNDTEIIEQKEEFEKEEANSSFQVRPGHFLIVGLFIGIIVSYTNANRNVVAKLSVLLLLVVSIMVLPAISQLWSEEVGKISDAPGDWDEEWPEEWKDTQIVVFELPDGEVVIGGLSGHENVEQLTDNAALELGIEVEKESFSIGDMIVSFNGHELDGWEFTIDGERIQTGISVAEVGEDSVVRWYAA